VTTTPSTSGAKVCVSNALVLSRLWHVLAVVTNSFDGRQAYRWRPGCK
jgi:hypothetical protein